MATIGGPNIGTDGLILALDAGNIKSFRGEPTVNLANTDTSRTLIKHDSEASVTFSDVPEKGDGWKKITINTRGSNFRIARFPYISQPTSTIRTYSVEVDFGTTSGYYVRIDGFSGGANNFSSGRIFTTFTTTTNSGLLALFINNNTTSTSGLNDVIYYRYYQVENMPYPTAFTEGTRGTTVATGGGWADISGNNNSGELINGVGYNSDNLGSLVFDGVNDGIQLPGTNLSINQMTISSWNFSSNYNQSGFMFEKTTNGSVNTQYSLFYNGANNLYYRTYGLSTTDLVLSSTTSYVINNKWNNVVATWDGTNKRIYVNGILIVTSVNLTGTVTQNTTGAAYIGIYGNFGGYPFQGRIAQTKIYNRALTSQEVQTNYNSTKARFGL